MSALEYNRVSRMPVFVNLAKIKRLSTTERLIFRNVRTIKGTEIQFLFAFCEKITYYYRKGGANDYQHG